MKQFRLATFAVVALAMGLGLAGNAQAAAYAYSQNSLLDGFFISNNSANVWKACQHIRPFRDASGSPSAGASDVRGRAA